MKYFLARQRPYNDKVKQTKDDLCIFLEEHLKSNLISIPYLHNKELIDTLGDINIDNTSEFIREFKEKAENNDIIDSNIKKRNDKISRIIKLLEAVNSDNVSLIVPHYDKILMIEIDNVIIKYTFNTLGYKYNNSNYKMLSTNKKVKEICTTYSLKIKNINTLQKPSKLRLPPHSLQCLPEDYVENNIVNKSIY